jgi:ATP synthase protein I
MHPRTGSAMPPIVRSRALAVAAWGLSLWTGRMTATLVAKVAETRVRQGDFRRVRVSSYNSEALLSSPLMAIERPPRSDRWDDEQDKGSWGEPAAAVVPLTREQAQALRDTDPPLSPWRVIVVQAGVGAVVALLAVLITGKQEMAWSALFGAAVVVLPGALMARGMTSRLSSMSAGASAVSFMLWEMVKIGVSVAMLVLAPRLVQSLSWPALLVGLVLCMKVNWLALLWRRPAKR